MSGTEKKNMSVEVSQWFMSCLYKYDQSISEQGLNLLQNMTIIPQRGMCVCRKF